MENPILTLRKALRLSQQQFAGLCGVSVASIQNWEGGKKPDQLKLNKLAHVAHTNGLVDISERIANLRASHQDGDHESAASRQAPPVAKAYPAAKHQEAHDLLDEILESGDPDAIPAVLSNLHVFGKYVKKNSGERLKRKG